MTPPYDHEALWLKAKLFTNWANETDAGKTFDERALWASLALELLAKATLARASPLLIALPDEKGGNLLIASGLMEGTARFNTIPAHTLFDRCSKAFPPFSLKEAKRVSNERNEYLHGPAATFSPFPEPQWWSRYWALVAILVNALDRELEELVGSDHLETVEAHLAQNRKNLEHRLQMLIERAKQRLAQFESGTLPAKVAGKWKPGSPVDAALSHHVDATCPACGHIGAIEGDNIEDVEVGYDQIYEGEYEPTIQVVVTSEHFGCSNCGLVLDTTELIALAGLDTSFPDVGGEEDLEEYEYEYGND